MVEYTVKLADTSASGLTVTELFKMPVKDIVAEFLPEMISSEPDCSEEQRQLLTAMLAAGTLNIGTGMQIVIENHVAIGPRFDNKVVSVTYGGKVDNLKDALYLQHEIESSQETAGVMQLKYEDNVFFLLFDGQKKALHLQPRIHFSGNLTKKNPFLYLTLQVTCDTISLAELKLAVANKMHPTAKYWFALGKLFSLLHHIKAATEDFKKIYEKIDTHPEEMMAYQQEAFENWKKSSKVHSDVVDIVAAAQALENGVELTPDERTDVSMLESTHALIVGAKVRLIINKLEQESLQMEGVHLGGTILGMKMLLQKIFAENEKLLPAELSEVEMHAARYNIDVSRATSIVLSLFQQADALEKFTALCEYIGNYGERSGYFVVNINELYNAATNTNRKHNAKNEKIATQNQLTQEIVEIETASITITSVDRVVISDRGLTDSETVKDLLGVHPAVCLHSAAHIRGMWSPSGVSNPETSQGIRPPSMGSAPL